MYYRIGSFLSIPTALGKGESMFFSISICHQTTEPTFGRLRKRTFAVAQGLFGLILAFVILSGPLSAQEKTGTPEENKAVGEQSEENQEGEETTAEDREKVNPFFETLILPDRTVQRRFDQAIRLIEAQRIAEAAQLLGSILESPLDFFIPPPYEKKEGEEEPSVQTTNRSFGEKVLETLLGLPGRARESYAMQFDAQAKRLLEQSIEQGSFEGIQLVAKRYFPTSSGFMAMFLLGMTQFEQGDYDAALLTLRRLEADKIRNRTELVEYEPLFSMTLASCRLRLGHRDQALETLARFLERCPNPKLLLAGKDPWSPGSAEEILARLEESLRSSENLSMADWLDRTGWYLGSAIPTQNPEARVDRPLLELLWSVPALLQARFLPQAELLERILRDARESYMPAPQPLFVQERIVMRGLGELSAIDPLTGKRLWSFPEEELRIPTAIHAPSRMSLQHLSAIPNAHRFALRIFFWHDRITHLMSSDGERVFAVEGLDPLPISTVRNQWMRRGTLQVGGRFVEDPRARVGNTMLARDVKTGRMLWKIGKFPYAQKVFDDLGKELQGSADAPKQAEKKEKPENEANPPAESAKDRKDGESSFTEEELFFSETWFLGAPLPLQGRLYAIAENAGVLQLIVLDAATGKLITRQPILLVQTPFETDWLRRYYGLIPSASGGILFCPTGLGMVGAFDASTASPLWCFSYRKTFAKEPENRNQFQNARHFHFDTSGNNEAMQRMFAGTGWQVPTIMVDKDRLLVAPPDVPHLYCLDSLTGELLWKYDKLGRDNALFVACIREGTAYLVTPRSMVALSMETGEVLWEPVLLKKTPSANAGANRGTIRNLPQMETLTPKRPESKKPAADQATSNRPKLVFPDQVRPTGIGLRNEHRYFLPMTDGALAVIDLDQASCEWISARQSGSRQPETEKVVQDKPDTASGDGEEDLVADEEQVIGAAIPQPRGTAPFPLSDLFASGSSKQLTLGNILAIQGRFYSQTPLKLVCFDQWEPLKHRTDAALEANPGNPRALFDLGRIRVSEGHLPEAVALFQRSLKAEPSEEVANALMEALLKAIRDDYSSWKTYGTELERLTDIPEQLGEIYYVLARGALSAGEIDRFIELLQKAIRLEFDYPVSVVVDSEWATQLHRALGGLIANQNDPGFRERLQAFAESVLDRFLDPNAPAPPGDSAGPEPIRPWWEQESTGLSSREIRQLELFLGLFGSLPAAHRAQGLLEERLRWNDQVAALELHLNLPVYQPVPTPDATEPPTESVAPGTSPSSPGVLPPELETRPDLLTGTLPDRESLQRLAAFHRTQGDPADAYYCYRILKEFYGEAGDELYREAMLSSAMEEYIRLEIDPAPWPKGIVQFLDESETEDAIGLHRNNPHGWAATKILRDIQSQSRFSNYRVSVPFLGPYEPFLSPYSYSLETTQHENELVCYDPSGKERWRFNITSIIEDVSRFGYYADSGHFRPDTQQAVYVKGCLHLLVFVRGNTIIAIDTFRSDREDAPRLLWTRTTTSSLSTRSFSGAVAPSRFHSDNLSNRIRIFPRESILVSSQILCYRDEDRIFGLDPMTGRTIWCRDLRTKSCSVLGDHDHLFLAFPDTLRAQAIDPESGRILAEGSIPSGGFYADGTNLVCLKKQESVFAAGQKNSYQVGVVDLKDLLLVPETPAAQKIEEASIPFYSIREGLSGDSRIRPVVHGRFLASLSRETSTMQIYDLNAKRDLFGPEGDWGRRVGAAIRKSTGEGEGIKQSVAAPEDFDVEIYDHRFLIRLVEKRMVDAEQKEITEQGRTFKRTRNAIANVPCRPVGRGMLMLYDADGKECWEKPALIEDWYYVQNMPERSPVCLFAIAVNDQQLHGNRNQFSTALLGIDKRTGKQSFSKQIFPMERNPQSILQAFRVTVEQDRDELVFLAPNRTLHARFTDRVLLPTEWKEKKEAPAKPKPSRWKFDFKFGFE